MGGITEGDLLVTMKELSPIPTRVGACQAVITTLEGLPEATMAAQSIALIRVAAYPVNIAQAVLSGVMKVGRSPILTPRGMFTAKIMQQGDLSDKMDIWFRAV